MLQAIAAIAGLAILMWSLGLPSLRFTEAAALTTISDTLSDSAPSVGSNHTIVFTTPTGLTAGQDIVITFPDGASDFDLSTIGAEDIDLSTTTDYSLQNGAAAGETWGVSTSTFAITLSSGSAVLDANATITIEIGSNAAFEPGAGQSQITNPTAGSYEIEVDLGGTTDVGYTRVAIIPTVEVTASVDTRFDFTVTGVAPGVNVNGTTTTGSSTPIAIPFGQLEAGVASTAAQNLGVITNARNGFVVTVQVDHQLLSATGADIDGFIEGAYTSAPEPWVAPVPVAGQENTYGHWGITSNDATVGAGLTDDFDVGGDGQDYLSASSTAAVEVFRHDGPADGSGQGQGTARIGYTVQISSLQEAADDYEASITYVATPVF